MWWIRSVRNLILSTAGWSTVPHDWESRSIENANFRDYCTGLVYARLRALMVALMLFVSVSVGMGAALSLMPFSPHLAIGYGAFLLFTLVQYIVIASSRAIRWSFLHGYLASLAVGGWIATMEPAHGGMLFDGFAGLSFALFTINLLLPWGARHTAVSGLTLLAIYGGTLAGLSGGFDVSTRVGNLFALAALVGLLILVNHLRYRDLRIEFANLVGLDRAEKELIAAKRDVEERERSIRSLLDLSNRGVLFFDQNFRVGPVYSKECERIFGRSMEGASVDELLFSDPESRSNFRKYLGLYFGGAARPEVVFEFLDTGYMVGGKYIEIEFHAVDASRVMLSLVDKTQESKFLENYHVESEKWHMVRNVIANRKAFVAYIRNTRYRLGAMENGQEPLSKLIREIQILKAGAGFLGFHKTQNAADQLEDLLVQGANLGLAIRPREKVKALQDAYSREMATVLDALGREWNLDADTVEVPRDEYIELVEFVESHCENPLLIKRIEQYGKTPLSQLMAWFPQLAADLAVKQRKILAPLVITGGEILVDGGAFEPLIRSFSEMVCNMVDHGIEMPEVRLQKGKPAIGSLSISVKEVENELEFTFSDDGKGIPLRGIEEKARKRGLIGPDETLLSSDLLQMIFLDRFSTKANSSDTPGKGAGLFAVRQAVNEVGGRIEVAVTRDAGTTFRIVVPGQIKKQRIQVAT